ncbi:hypothetical protein JXA59_00005, partial [Patescibacteria group bacterium]|nr:hypothetical protein [Patescibacteria group bacterium]
MRKQIQKFIWKLLERELMVVLAVSFVGLTMVFTKAGTSTEALVSFTIVPAAGAITVTAPNGGERWTIGTGHNITWDTMGEVA